MKTRQVISGVTSEKDKESTICERCGNEFTCGAMLTDCWCMDLKLTDEARTELKSKYNDCVCNNCLATFAAE